MKIMTWLIVLILIPVFYTTTTAEERVEPTSMKELTDPKSPSYVPYPYPTTRKEIIGDLMYYIKKVVTRDDEHVYKENGKRISVDRIMLNFLESDPIYRVEEIQRVKNLNRYSAHDFEWLLIVRDKKNKIVARLTLNANGLMGTMHAIGEPPKKLMEKIGGKLRGVFHVFSEKEILDIIYEKMGKRILEIDVKKMERIILSPGIARSTAPAFEITLKNGKVYYYSTMMDKVYVIDKKIPSRRYVPGSCVAARQQVNKMKNPIIALDTIDEYILVFREVNKSNPE